MNKKPLFSILVPIYKSNKEYFAEMIESVLSQTFQDFEVILDDCSNFCSSNPNLIPDDKRIKVVVQKENRGLAASRNNGVNASSGEYLIFLDDDDKLSPVFLEMASKYLNKNSLIFLRDSNDKNQIAESICKENVTIFEKDDIDSFFIRYNSKRKYPAVEQHSSWAKVFPREFFDNNLFIEQQSFVGEDTLFLWKSVDKMDQIICLDYQPYYFYRQRDHSLSKGYQKGVTDKMISLIENLNHYAKNQFYKNQLLFEIINVYFYIVCSQEIFNKNNAIKFKERKELLKKFLNNQIVSSAFKSSLNKYLNSIGKKTIAFLIKMRVYSLLSILLLIKY